MDRVFYFLLVLVVVGYFMIPKICCFDSPQLFWQYQFDKLKYYSTDLKGKAKELSPYLPKKFTPKAAADFYQNLIMEQLQSLGNIQF